MSFWTKLFRAREFPKVGMAKRESTQPSATSSPQHPSIHDAAREGDLEKVEALLKSNPDLVFSKANNGATPLHLAAGRGHKDVAEVLLAHKAEVNAKDSNGRTPFYWAAAKDHKEVAELLLAKGADINVAVTAANLDSWKSSGEPEAWVRKHLHGWNHNDWLELLASLRGSRYWPMDEAAIGQHLEMLRDRLRRAAGTQPIEEPLRANLANAGRVITFDLRPIERVIICAGPGSSRIDVAKKMKESCPPDVNVLVCSNAIDIQEQLRPYQNRRITVMLQYFFGQHPKGSKGALDWHPRFMDTFDAEVNSKRLQTKPDIKTTVNKDTGSVFLICPWITEVKVADVVHFTSALEASFAQVGWMEEPAIGQHLEVLRDTLRARRQTLESEILWDTYDYVDQDARKVAEGAIRGDIDITALSRVLSNIYARSYLLELGESLEKRECPATDCQEYRGYLIAGEPGAALTVEGGRVVCSRCRRSCYLDHFDEAGRNKLAVAIGEAVACKGGVQLMKAVADRFEPRRKAYLLSHSWDRVGGWFA